MRLRDVVTTSVAVRLLADGLIVAAMWLLAYLLRFLWEVIFGDFEQGRRIELFRFLTNYLATVGIVTATNLSVFCLNGFYTHGRSYTSRYKALVVAQGVSVAYLIVALIAFLLRDLLPVPRSVLPMAWMLSLGALVTARLWSTLWKYLVKRERVLESGDRARRPESILVIGGAGYIGSALLPKLLAKGFSVRLLDLFLYGRDPIAQVANHPKLEIIQGDFRQIDQVVQGMQDMDAVIHLGGIVGDPACALDEQLTIEVNLMATRLIAEVAKGHSVRRFLFASSCSVYGANDSILDENSLLNPVSLYASSKIASERVLMDLASASFSPTILRFGTIYGLSGRTRFDLVVNLLTAKAMNEKKLTLFGGDQWRPFVHVDDAAAAVLLALEAPLEIVADQIFNVGSDEQNKTLREVGELIQKLVPSAELVDMGRDTDARNYRVAFFKIRSALNYVPKWSLEDGILQVIESLRSGQVLDYKDSRYSNVKFLTDDRNSQLISTTGWERKLIQEVAPAQR